MLRENSGVPPIGCVLRSPDDGQLRETGFFLVHIPGGWCKDMWPEFVGSDGPGCRSGVVGVHPRHLVAGSVLVEIGMRLRVRDRSGVGVRLADEPGQPAQVVAVAERGEGRVVQSRLLESASQVDAGAVREQQAVHLLRLGSDPGRQQVDVPAELVQRDLADGGGLVLE